MLIFKVFKSTTSQDEPIHKRQELILQSITDLFRFHSTKTVPKRRDHI